MLVTSRSNQGGVCPYENEDAVELRVVPRRCRDIRESAPRMTPLSTVVHCRDNNFHLVRLLAASAVLLSHSFPLSTGTVATEPLRALLGCTPGSIAVDLFFTISGLLVTMSLVRRNSVADFVRARFFRIWPALTVAILLAIFVVGPIFTALPLAAYFSAHDTWRYLAKNLVLLHGIVYTLPGVFDGNPSPHAINGSLWTLPSEVRCYLYLLAAWIAVRKLTSERVFRLFATGLWLALLCWHCWSLGQSTLEQSPARLNLMFASGVALYLYRDRVVLSWRGLGAVLAALALSTLDLKAFGVVYVLALPYIMLCLAYLPRGRILGFNKLGDYSYGVYVYAYPIQQTLMCLVPTLGPGALFAAAMPTTLALAVLSWHFIEKPALRLARPARPTLAMGPSAA
jgi:peptidoglycan/LPS O-acetylase OafA/YrhL